MTFYDSLLIFRFYHSMSYPFYCKCQSSGGSRPSDKAEKNRSTWRKTSRSKGAERITNSTYIWRPSRDLNPGEHQVEASALTTTPPSTASLKSSA